MPRNLFSTLVLLTVAAILAGGSSHALADELVINGGFESGIVGWTPGNPDTGVEIVPTAHSGESSARINTGSAFDAEIFQIIPIAPNEVYWLGAWVRVPDSDFERVFLRIRWLESLAPGLGPTQDSAYVVHSAESYQFVGTQFLVSPPYAAAARVSVHVLADKANYSFDVDDISLEGAPPPAPTPQPTEPPATNPPTAVPTPPPATKTPTPKATTKPTAKPTAQPTPKPTPTPTPKPTPSPIPPSTPADPIVFSGLTNGGFEQAGSEGAPYGWRKIGGSIRRASNPVRSGSHSLELRSLTTSTKWAFQAVGVTAGSHYAASGYAWHADSDTDAVFLRVSWYATSDGSGEAISTVDSQQLLEPAQPIWRELSTGAVLAPGGAQSARVRLMLRPEGGAEATAYFDDIAFVQTAAPLAPTHTATAAPAPGETAPPQAKSPTPKSSLAASAAPTFAPPDEEGDEPGHFQALTNGSFEDVREDGTPYGWRKQGGEFSADDSSTAEGSLALLMRSESTSTKWVHQAVSVSGGAWYEFSGFASAPGGGTELFLRVAWYASNNASGSALASEDSTTSIVGPVSGFHYLTTGAIHAPAEARSARLRLMLRPAGSGDAIGYFDALRFEVTVPAPGGSASSIANAAGSSRGSGSVTSGGSEVSEEGSERAPVLGVLATPFDVSNVAGDGSGESAVASDSGNTSRPWIWLAIAVPVVGLAAIGAVEVRRWALRRDEELEQVAEE